MTKEAAVLVDGDLSSSVGSAADKIRGLLTQTGDEDASETADAEHDETASDETTDETEAETAEGESADEETSEETQSDEQVDEDAQPDTKPTTRSRKLRLPDGTEQEVTEDEAYNGYLRQADYTRKTQAIAENQRQLGSEKAAITQKRQQLDEGLKQIEDALTVMMPKEPDWEKVRQDDPAAYPALYTDWQRYQERLAAVKAARKQLADETTAEQAAALQQRAKDEFQKLTSAVPEWSDRKRMVSDFAKIAETARAYGFTAEEIDGIADHRVGLLLRDAMLYRDLKTKQAEGKAKIDKVTRGVKSAAPGSAKVASAPTKAAKAAREKLAKTGRVGDAAAAILPYLTGGRK